MGGRTAAPTTTRAAAAASARPSCQSPTPESDPRRRVPRRPLFGPIAPAACKVRLPRSRSQLVLRLGKAEGGGEGAWPTLRAAARG